MIRFSPERMRHVSIFILDEDAPRVSALLARFGWFDPDHAQALRQDHARQPERAYHSLYQRARKRYDKITHFINSPDCRDNNLYSEPATYPELSELDTRLGELWKKCSAYEERQRRLGEEARHIRQLQSTLQYYRALNINLDTLQRPHSFLDIRLGTVPLSEVNKLRDAISLNNYVLMVIKYSENLAHIVFAGDVTRSDSVEKVLNAASFRATRLPDEFHDYPERLEQELAEKYNDTIRQQQELAEIIKATANDYAELLCSARDLLNVSSAYAELSARLASKGSLNLIQGWVPLQRVNSLETYLDSQLESRYFMETRPPSLAERSVVPSYTEYPAFLRPFATLVRNYGVPRYGEFDPVWLFAISYVLMFGMMFGDIGHGLVIAFAGFMLRGRLKKYWPFFLSVGISSSIFGFVYGSIFGYEDVLPPLWVSPLHDPVLLLEVALGWGAIFIALMLILGMRNEWIDGKRETAMLGGHGLVGLLLYFGLLSLGWQIVTNGEVEVWSTALVVISITSMMIHGWRSSSTSGAERFIIVFIETFETLVGLFSNTLSFLRVAAFSINHVALVVAVFAIANMFDSTGEWVTIILGNIFVLVLEGAIVAIQTLRLEYYEGFSRFYRGDGVSFKPLRFGNAK